LKINRPNQVWAIDISYIPMERGYMYLLVIMDWHSAELRKSWGRCREKISSAARNKITPKTNKRQGGQLDRNRGVK
jgi:hypothetical protein